MRHHALHLAGREVERVLPEVAALPVGVLLHLLVVRQHGEVARVGARQPLHREEHAAVRPGLRREVHGVGQQVAARVAGLGRRLVDAQQRVAEHGGGVVHERLGQHERHRVGVDPRLPGGVARAVSRRQLGRVEADALRQPGQAGGVGAARVLAVARAGGRVQEVAERRLELRGRVRLAARGAEEVRVVGQALHAAAQAPRAVVEQRVPLGGIRQVERAGARDPRVDRRRRCRGAGRRGAGGEEHQRDEGPRALTRTSASACGARLAGFAAGEPPGLAGSAARARAGREGKAWEPEGRRCAGPRPPAQPRSSLAIRRSSVSSIFPAVCSVDGNSSPKCRCVIV